MSGVGRLAADWLWLVGKAADPEGTLRLHSPLNDRIQQLFGAGNLGDLVVKLGRKLGPDALASIGDQVQNDMEIYQRINVPNTPLNAVSRGLGALVPDLALSYALPEVKIAHVLFWPALAYTKARGEGKSQAEAVQAAIEAAAMLKAGEPLAPLARELTDSRAVALVKKGFRALLGGEFGFVSGALQPGATPSSALASAVQFGGMSAKGAEPMESRPNAPSAGEGWTGYTASGSGKAEAPEGKGAEGILEGIRRIAGGASNATQASAGGAIRLGRLDYTEGQAQQPFGETKTKWSLERVGEVGRETPEAAPGRASIDEHEKIASFRRRAGIARYVLEDKPTGAVARVEANGRTFYGVSTGLQRGAAKGALRVAAFERLRENFLWARRWSDVEFLKHAEAHALLRAAGSGRLPLRLSIYVDRPTCPWCRNQLGYLLRDLGVEELTIHILGERIPIRILPSSSILE